MAHTAKPIRYLYRQVKTARERIKSAIGVSPPHPYHRVMGYRTALCGPPRGRALVSYITEPFKSDDPSKLSSHQNQWEAVEIVHILNKLGFIVDVVDYRDTEYEPSAVYELLFGIGSNFERLARALREPIRKIFYATGSHWSFQNRSERERLVSLEKRRGITLNARRTVLPHGSPELADAVLCIGNDVTRSTYSPYAAHIVCIDTSSYDTLAWPLGKNFAEARRRFFWFGGKGAVHKGLDLVLEVFNELPDLQLFIGGAVADELDFVEAYGQELYNRANIRLVGWINVESTLFADITRNCGYVIFPSCSEGQAGSVTACMHRGLVPIVTREVGIDTKDFGITLKDCQPRTMSEAVVHAANQSAAALEQHSRMAYDEAKVRYTRAAFSRNCENAMRRLMGKRYFSVGHGYPHDAFPF